MQTGLEDAYLVKDGKKLRLGYTTGSCAAAAAQASAICLLTGNRPDRAELMTPKGIQLCLPVCFFQETECEVTFGVKKDGGDDPDATHGLWILATVSRLTEPEIVIDGGKGVGRVTRSGLDQPPGAAAINRVPRAMIREQVLKVMQKEGYPGGIRVVISVPEGEETAKRTFNPRLGIVGGISILGTSGIVMPMSEEALIATIRVEMEMRRASGSRYLLMVPGNYGEDFLSRYPQVDTEQAVKCSNYVGAVLEMAVEMEFEGILFVAHIGKFIKVSGGIMNTHSHQADCRAELLAAQALRRGADPETVRRILATDTTEEAVEILVHAGCLSETMEEVMERIVFYMQHHTEGRIRTEAIVFSSWHGVLGESAGAGELIRQFQKKSKTPQQATGHQTCPGEEEKG